MHRENITIILVVTSLFMTASGRAQEPAQSSDIGPSEERPIKSGPVRGTPSRAAESEAAPTQLKIPEVAVTATRTRESISSIPGAVTVITREQIEEQRYMSRGLSDILAQLVPGMAPSTQSLSIFGQGIRGRNVLILIDGVPQSTSRNSFRELQTIDPYAVERIEVVRGATAIYGDGATGGIINIITKQAGEGKPSLRPKG